MRDYNEPFSGAIWSAVEKALNVGYGDATVDFHGTEPELTARAHPKDKDTPYVEADGVSRSDACEHLKRKCIDLVYTRAFQEFLNIVPDEARTAIMDAALRLLQTQYAVFTASKDTTADDLAYQLLRQDYYEDVRDRAKEIKDRVLAGDIKDSEGVYEALQQIEVIYTSDALNTIRISDNDREYWEQMGGEAPDWSVVAAFAKQADVREALDFDPENIEEHECARCGDVVTIEEDAEECPKCGLSFDVTVSEGAEICVEGASEDTCNSCLEEHPEVKDSAITRLADYEFTCYYCNSDFITPQAPVAPPAPPPPPTQPDILFHFVFTLGRNNGAIDILAKSRDHALATFRAMPRKNLIEALDTEGAEPFIVDVCDPNNPKPVEE